MNPFFNINKPADNVEINKKKNLSNLQIIVLLFLIYLFIYFIVSYFDRSTDP
jgi:hypothetical protein